MNFLDEDDDEEGTGDDMDSHTLHEIPPEFDAEFMKDYELIEKVTSFSGDYIINPVDFYRNIIMNKILNLVSAWQIF